MKVACIQMRSSTNIADNMATVSEFVVNTSHKQVDLIATPEMTSLMDQRRGQLFNKAKAEAADDALHAFRELAKQCKVNLLIGSIPILVSDNKCANRSYLISGSGEITSTYDKIHMFDVEFPSGERYRESKDFAAGDKISLAKVNGVTIGHSICYDLRFPSLYHDLAQLGAKIIAVPAAFTKTTGEAHWHTLLRARAIENGCFIIAPAQGGMHEDGRETYGHSLIIDPWGRILAEAEKDPIIIYADLDLTLVDKARQSIPNLKHARPYKK